MEKFTRADLINAVAENTDLSRREAEHIVHLQQDALTRALATGKRISIFGFGSLNSVPVPSRMIRNPATGAQMRSKKSARVYFRPAPILKDFITGAKKLPKNKLVTDVTINRKSS